MSLLDDLLVCPVDGSRLVRVGTEWKSAEGRVYPEIEGIPILFHPESADTFAAMTSARELANPESLKADPWLIETLGLNAEQMQAVRNQRDMNDYVVDPVVSYIVGATCGNLYVHAIGQLKRYPIPDFRWKQGNGQVMLDIGCNWGRWCIAAVRQGFAPIGLDPQIGALLAAQRVCRDLGVSAQFVCGDARHLPLRTDAIDFVYSYSVLQHLSRKDVETVTSSIQRALVPGGTMVVQMPHRNGPRCFYQWAKRGFSDGDGFQVRYWTRSQLEKTFEKIGRVSYTTEGYLGIGLQPADRDLLPTKYQFVISASEFARRMERWIPFLSRFSDSLYVHADKPE